MQHRPQLANDKHGGIALECGDALQSLSLLNQYAFSLDIVQSFTVYRQPFSVLVVVWHHRADEGPKPRTVVHFRQVCQFVDDDVRLNLFWRLDEAPVQIDIPLARTAPPSTFLLFNDNLVGTAVKFCRQILRERAQVRFCK